jgi:N-acetylglucosamine-6-phosphate deacetylase
MGVTDLQINGYAGVDFNSDALTAEALHDACARLDADGVDTCLATIITDDLDRMCARLRALARVRADDPLVARVVAGAHVEGPFISPVEGFRGAHPVSHVRPASLAAVERLLEAGGGLIAVVTLAPEQDPDCRITRLLAGLGIVVSAGHTDASLEQLQAAIDAGLSMFTHVGNGCPTLLPRHDNIVQRALSCERLWLSFIADGVHVPWPALGNYVRAAGVARTVIVSDAVAAAGLGPGRYTLGGLQVEVGEDLVVRAGNGPYLAGSAVGLPHSARTLGAHLRCTEEEVALMTAFNPRRVLAGARPGER